MCTIENPDDIIDLLSATLYDCYSYELDKCLTAPLNDWLMNEKLLKEATIRGKFFFQVLTTLFGSTCFSKTYTQETGKQCG